MLRASDLQGFNITGLNERLICTLFADDTTVYLSEHDNYGTLCTILETWCSASGAKFNEGKTECVPIGSPEFRANFIVNRRAHPNHEQLPASAKISADGHTIRILGIWAGNGANDEDPWLKVLRKCSDTLAHWDRTHPTIKGRRMLIQAYIGGGTQYLTAAQGMPPEILARLKKLELDFFWAYKRTHTINSDTLYLPTDAGGASLLDLEARNDAIYLTWVRDYAAAPLCRPTWAFVADAIFRHTTTLLWQDRFEDSEQLMDTFLTQQWAPTVRTSSNQVRGGHARRANLQATGLPLELELLFKTAKRYNTRLVAPYVSVEARLSRNIWYHSEHMSEHPQRHSGSTVECLRHTHGIVSVEDAVRCGSNPFDTRNPTVRRGRHSRRRNCACRHCRDQRAAGCAHPYLCQELAMDMVTSIGETWRPDWGERDSANDLSAQEREQNVEAEKRGDPVLFDSAIPMPARHEDYARVFTDTLVVMPAREERDLGYHEFCSEDNDELTSAIWAHVKKPKMHDAIAAYAIACSGADVRKAARCPDGPQSKERAVALGVIALAALTPPDRPLLIRTNAVKAIKRLTTSKDKHEALGWTNCGLEGDVFRAAVACLRAQSARTRLEYVAPNDHLDTSNAASDAKRATVENQAQEGQTPAPAEFDLPGMPLSSTLR